MITSIDPSIKLDYRKYPATNQISLQNEDVEEIHVEDGLYISKKKRYAEESTKPEN